MSFDLGKKPILDNPLAARAPAPPAVEPLVRDAAPSSSLAPAPTSAAQGAGGTHGAPLPGRGFSGSEVARIGGSASPEEARKQDRALARQELAGQFQVVPPGFQGPRLPNQVTEAELEQLCGNYSDIRMGSSNIKLDTGEMAPEQAGAFRSGVMGDISSMLQTAGGRDLIAQLTDAKAKDGTARTTSISPTIAPPDMFNHTMTNKAWWEGGDDAKIFSPGIGANAMVAHTPGKDRNWRGATSDAPSAGGIRSDVGLFTNMVKALHMIRGQYLSGDSPGANDLPLGSEPEEYAAIGLAPFASSPLNENAYRSERQSMANGPGARPGDELPSMAQRTSVKP